MSFPQLVVFDLDYTLWDCGGTWCDCLTPPFSGSGQQVRDSTGRHVQLYEDVLWILDHCDSHGVPMALASRTQEPDWARELIERLDVAHRFAHAEIYPSSKLAHFCELRNQSGVAFEEMLFFDDEMRNINEVSRLGVNSIFVPAGINRELFDSGWAG